MEMLSELKKFFKPSTALIPIKIAMFCYHAACELISPYTALQALEVGLTLDQMTFIFSLLPIASMAGPTVVGYLCDRFGHLKLVMIMCIFTCGLLHTLLLYVDVISAFPTNQWPIIVSFHCNDMAIASLWNRSIALEIGDSFNMAMPAADCGPSSSSGYCTLRNLTVEVVDCDRLKVVETQYENRSKSICQQFTDRPWETGPFLENLHDGNSFKTTTGLPLGVWCYVIFLFIGRSTQNAIVSVLESCSVQLAQCNGGSIGSQKVFGVISKTIFSFVGAALINVMKQISGRRIFTLLFYGADIMLLFLTISVLNLDLHVEVRKDSTFWRNVREIVSFPDINIFLIVVIVTGTLNYFIETFFYVYLAELGASEFFMSLTSATMNIASIPLLLMGDCAVLKLGYGSVISLSLLIYGVRMAAYSVIRNPWLCLPLEVLKAFTSQFVSVAAGMFCSSAAPAGLYLTLCGLNHACNFALGRGLGSFLSGVLTNNLGRPYGFQLMAAAAVAAAILYYLTYHFYLKDMEMNRRCKSQISYPK